MVGVSQTAFIPGRNIIDGVVILYEVLLHLKSRKEEGIILKLDFEKAYDKVNWGFLKEVMLSKNFPTEWVDWTMSVVTRGRVAINLNGERGNILGATKD